MVFERHLSVLLRIGVYSVCPVLRCFGCFAYVAQTIVTNNTSNLLIGYTITVQFVPFMYRYFPIALVHCVNRRKRLCVFKQQLSVVLSAENVCTVWSLLCAVVFFVSYHCFIFFSVCPNIARKWFDNGCNVSLGVCHTFSSLQVSHAFVPVRILRRLKLRSVVSSQQCNIGPWYVFTVLVSLHILCCY